MAKKRKIIYKYIHIQGVKKGSHNLRWGTIKQKIKNV